MRLQKTKHFATLVHTPNLKLACFVCFLKIIYFFEI